MDKKTVVTGTIGEDAHMVATQLLSYALEKAGFNVECLGARVPQEEFIDAAIESNAVAILVSSLYGHGILDIEGFRDKCVEAGLKDILLYIGGILTPGGMETADGKGCEAIEARVKEIGFNRFYGPDANLEEAIADLKKDLGIS